MMDSLLDKISNMFNPLPKILATLTQPPRERVDNIDWSNKSWTHNIFRVYEIVFWRRAGIRAEISVHATLDNGKQCITYRFHSIEAIIGFAESWVRGLIPRSIPVKIWKPLMATSGGMLTIPGIYFAIAFDGNAQKETSGLTNTVSLTTSASNR